MSDAIFQRAPAVSRIGTVRRAGRLPTGYGLAIGAVVSLGLWGGIFWIVARLLG
jgi:hypothetical protein